MYRSAWPLLWMLFWGLIHVAYPKNILPVTIQISLSPWQNSSFSDRHFYSSKIIFSSWQKRALLKLFFFLRKKTSPDWRSKEPYLRSSQRWWRAFFGDIVAEAGNTTIWIVLVQEKTTGNAFGASGTRNMGLREQRWGIDVNQIELQW